MKFSSIVLFAFLGSVHAQVALLPSNLPKELSTPSIVTALKHWLEESSNLQGNSCVNTSACNLAFARKTYYGRPWIEVQFRLDFLFSNDEELTKEVVANIKHMVEGMMKQLNSYGAWIDVRFLTHVRLIHGDNTPEVLFKNALSRSPTGAYRIVVLREKDPFWKQEQSLLPDGNGRAYANIEHGLAYLTYEDLDNSSYPSKNILLHEMNHLLFLSQDAYEEDGRHRNMSVNDCRALDRLLGVAENYALIHPLEIYLGLKRHGQTAPGWDSYVNLSEAFDTENQQENTIRIRLFQRNPLEMFSTTLELKIYDTHGTLLHQIQEWRLKPDEGKKFPHDSVITWTPPKKGVYLISVSIMDEPTYPCDPHAESFECILKYKRMANVMPTRKTVKKVLVY